nr:TetR/AcrR family transcriptional regulator [uncultured Celeribacter sp.]
MTRAPAPTDTSPSADQGTEASASPKRQQILDGARTVFMQKGFEGASMQDIARTAGVSKGTLYVYFDNKEAMFDALVLSECGRMQDTLRQFGTGDGDLEQELRHVAHELIATMLRPEVLAAMRMVIGAAEKFPVLARKVFLAGPSRSIEILATCLEQRGAKGELHVPDSHSAATEFIDLLLPGLQRRALLMEPPPPAKELDTFIARRVRSFLTLYAPR